MTINKAVNDKKKRQHFFCREMKAFKVSHKVKRVSRHNLIFTLLETKRQGFLEFAKKIYLLKMQHSHIEVLWKVKVKIMFQSPSILPHH